MTKFRYFLISSLLFLAMLAMLFISIQSTDVEAMVNAIKAIFMPVLLFIVSLLLLVMSLYFFLKGRRKGRPKKHIRFL